MTITQHRERHDLNPGDYAFSEWEAEYKASAAYQDGDELLGLDAVVSRMGGSAICATVRRDGELITVSPYFNQSADDDPDDTGRTEADEIDNDPTEWLVVMAGATEWREWDWAVQG